jgi:hypothetical protein
MTLCVENLKIIAKCLLSEWFFKLLKEDGVRQELIRDKYIYAKSLFQVSAKPTGSSFWKRIMRVNEDLCCRGAFIVENGSNARFWEDTWLRGTPLTLKYASVCNVYQRKHVTMVKVMSNTPLSISFRRSLM